MREVVKSIKAEVLGEIKAVKDYIQEKGNNFYDEVANATTEISTLKQLMQVAAKHTNKEGILPEVMEFSLPLTEMD